MNDKDTTVLVNIETYQKLIQAETSLAFLAKMLLNTATGMNYRDDGLVFNDDIIDSVLKTFYPKEYSERFAEIRKAEEEK